MKYFVLKKLILVISLFIIYLKIILFKGIKESILTLPNSNNINGLLNCNIKNNTVLIFESEFFHHECTPGYTKYFLDLGYNVDIILDNFGSNSFCLFKSLENIRLFTFDRFSELSVHSEEFQLIFKNYSYIIIETTNPDRNKTYNELGFFKMNNTIFLLHTTEHIYRTKFFITSNGERNYQDLILAAEKIKNENLDFEVIVIGRGKSFSKEELSENLKENFQFKFNVIFKDLYEAVYSSDYIIINLYPNYKNNDLFRRNRLTGSLQLSLGFYKLALIHKSFAEFYNMTSENSFLFDNSNYYEIMHRAILLNDQEYKEKQKNLIKLSESLYKVSLGNIKKTFNSIL